MTPAIQHVGWTHPSWRDLVIDHLSKSPPDRIQFLSNCSIEGARLALSTAGGATGERATPLLAEPGDWLALEARLLILIQDRPDMTALPLLGSIRQTIETGAANSKGPIAPLMRLATATLMAIRAAWNESKQAITVPQLAAYSNASVLLSPIPPLPDFSPTWATLYAAAVDELSNDTDTDEPLLGGTSDWLELCELLRNTEPRFLNKASFPSAYKNIQNSVFERTRFWIDRKITRFDANAAIYALETVDWLPATLNRIALLFTEVTLEAHELSARVSALAEPLELRKEEALVEEGHETDPPERDDLTSSSIDDNDVSVSELFNDL